MSVQYERDIQQVTTLLKYMYMNNWENPDREKRLVTPSPDTQKD